MLLSLFSLLLSLELPFLKIVNNILEIMISDYFMKLLDVLGIFLINLTIPYALEQP